MIYQPLRQEIRDQIARIKRLTILSQASAWPSSPCNRNELHHMLFTRIRSLKKRLIASPTHSPFLVEYHACQLRVSSCMVIKPK